MTTLPRVDIMQERMPGLDGCDSRLTLHAVTDSNFSQRVTVARRCREQTHWRYHDIALTRVQVLDVIDHLIDRVDVMTDDIPVGRGTSVPQTRDGLTQ